MHRHNCGPAYTTPNQAAAASALFSATSATRSPRPTPSLPAARDLTSHPVQRAKLISRRCSAHAPDPQPQPHEATAKPPPVKPDLPENPLAKCTETLCVHANPARVRRPHQEITRRREDAKVWRVPQPTATSARKQRSPKRVFRLIEEVRRRAVPRAFASSRLCVNPDGADAGCKATVTISPVGGARSRWRSRRDNRLRASVRRRVT